MNTAPELVAKIDGEYVPIAECDWVRFDWCGCVTGVATARHSPTGELAWREFYDTKREIDQARRKGIRLELVTRVTYREVYAEQMSLRYHCPHNTAEVSS